MLFVISSILQVSNERANLEKKQKKIDQQINEWKGRIEDLQAELEASQKDARNASTEVCKL